MVRAMRALPMRLRANHRRRASDEPPRLAKEGHQDERGEDAQHAKSALPQPSHSTEVSVPLRRLPNMARDAKQSQELWEKRECVELLSFWCVCVNACVAP